MPPTYHDALDGVERSACGSLVVAGRLAGELREVLGRQDVAGSTKVPGSSSGLSVAAGPPKVAVGARAGRPRRRSLRVGAVDRE